MKRHLADTLHLSMTLVILPRGTWSGIASEGSSSLIPEGV